MTLRQKLFISSLVIVFNTLPSYAYAQLPSAVLTDQTRQVSEHVHMITGFPNIIFVSGDNAILVVDTGLGKEQGETITRVAQKLAPNLKLYLTTTHFHPEHAAGESGFPEETIIIRPLSQHQEMQRDGNAMIELFRGFGNFGPLLEGIEGIRQPDIVFDDKFTLDLGGVIVRLMWLGKAHTEGDELIFIENDRVLISGDIVQNKVVPTVAADGGSLTNWINVLTILEQLSPAIVIPTHSRVGTGQLISESRSFIIEMRKRALRLKSTGVPLDIATEQLTAEFQADYPLWASNTDWDNMQAISGFVERTYREANSLIKAF